ncbi:hypothetical protein RRG08_066236 [Elysia crispata]|uniref:Uncharacterized protein n=1 Tax=Elysia crispata TaxID=231223 RepID=A0AAE1EEP7_9GAST|nr:hypothetical protein RRG08_066236 [Elysia crispata]
MIRVLTKTSNCNFLEGFIVIASRFPPLSVPDVPLRMRAGGLVNDSSGHEYFMGVFFMSDCLRRTRGHSVVVYDIVGLRASWTLDSGCSGGRNPRSVHTEMNAARGHKTLSPDAITVAERISFLDLLVPAEIF